VSILNTVAGFQPVNQGEPEYVSAKFQVTQVLVDDGGTTVFAIFFGISRH